MGPSVSVRVFDAGKRFAAIRVAEAQRDQALAAFHSSLLSALEDVEDALVSLSRGRLRTAKLSEASHYREAAHLSRSLFESGNASFRDVLDAERSLYSAEDSPIQSRSAAAKNHVTLAKALGGGWVDRIDVETPIVVNLNKGPSFTGGALVTTLLNTRRIKLAAALLAAETTGVVAGAHLRDHRLRRLPISRRR